MNHSSVLFLPPNLVAKKFQDKELELMHVVAEDLVETSVCSSYSPQMNFRSLIFAS